jgi:predicted amidohydrolase/ribosomal protein S18 acetylase RimI-like enzyme
MTLANERTPKLLIRHATAKDVKDILNLVRGVYLGMPTYSDDMIRGQISNFPDGQFAATYEGKIVGYCATFMISGEIALQPHTWREITGDGFGSRHDECGDYLYGMEVCVDPSFRGMKIGQRFYNERKKLCQEKRLKGIIFGGRMPGLKKKIKAVKTPEAYLELIEEKKLNDQVVSFQLRNEFQVIGVLKDYLVSDKESMGHAAHMVWYNPRIDHNAKAPKIQRGRLPETVRIASIQYQQRKVSSFEEFTKNVRYFIDVVSDYKADFAVLPELFTLQLLSIKNEVLSPEEAVRVLTEYTEPFKAMMSDLAVKFNVNIIGGSHPTIRENGDVVNICYVFLRDGSIHQQLKIHPTPNERYWWNIKGGTELDAIMTDCGPIGVLICYDCEFPETARHLVNQGAQILFVPFCTDERQGYLRVRYCAQARAVENQCFVAMAGNVGNLPGVENMDVQYAQSCILTPCDFPFARDGIAADTTPNVETIALADVRISSLVSARNSGTVQNLKDRRFDLYSIKWHKE